VLDFLDSIFVGLMLPTIVFVEVKERTCGQITLMARRNELGLSLLVSKDYDL
jgi:hypothetical protein